jgi:hypothetical protein
LLSCPALNQVLITNEARFSANQFIGQYTAIVRAAGPDVSAHGVELGQILVDSRIDLGPISAENLTRVIHMFDALEVKKLFSVGYFHDTYCLACDDFTSAMAATIYAIDIPPDIVLHTQAEYQNYILAHEAGQRIGEAGRLCETCGVQGKFGRILRLARLSEIIIICQFGPARFFPLGLEFPSKAGHLRYQAVAQINLREAGPTAGKSVPSGQGDRPEDSADEWLCPVSSSPPDTAATRLGQPAEHTLSEYEREAIIPEYESLRETSFQDEYEVDSGYEKSQTATDNVAGVPADDAPNADGAVDNADDDSSSDDEYVRVVITPRIHYSAKCIRQNGTFCLDDDAVTPAVIGQDGDARIAIYHII